MSVCWFNRCNQKITQFNLRQQDKLLIKEHVTKSKSAFPDVFFISKKIAGGWICLIFFLLFLKHIPVLRKILDTGIHRSDQNNPLAR